MTNKDFDLKFEKLRKKSFAIYCVLADILAKENPTHVPSRIDQLTGEYLAEYADMWQGYKLKNNRIAELEEENAKLRAKLKGVKNGKF